ncbi:MAG TPA: Obg family GTPase CgtA, partial [Acholeplasmataceae bacterium]|nr:Obg family GTPase CgtA [Acholeplasmataceae bacterium]
SALSAARPKIADYPFTTLVPNLGVVRAKDGRSFVMADLPGLIEGASQGAGLGFRFLKHIERTRVIVHVIDMSGERDPYEDYLVINKELETYNPKLLKRPQIIAANKMDLPEAEEKLKVLQEKVKDVPVIPISAYMRRNLDALVYKIADTLETVALDAFVEPVNDEVVEYKFTPAPPPFTITKAEDGVYVVDGPAVRKYFERTNFDRESEVKLFAQRLRKLGVDAELRKLGVKNGDTVRVIKYEFEFLD